MQNENTRQTVIAAQIAAELYHAQQITKSLSISSKNLRTLAKRIGHNAAGLAVLASFYDECSRESISLANQVSSLTITTANETVKQWRFSLFEQELKKACRNLEDSEIPTIVKDSLEKSPLQKEEMNKLTEQFRKDLFFLLQEMQKNIRSIAVIAVNSKIEAPKTGEHSAALLDMAQNVEIMIEKILKHIDRAYKYLHS